MRPATGWPTATFGRIAKVGRLSPDSLLRPPVSIHHPDCCMIVRRPPGLRSRLWLLLLVLLPSALPARAQGVPPTYKGGLTLTEPAKAWRLDLIGGHQFGGRLELIEGRLRLREGFVWGGAVSYGLRNNTRFTVTYLNQLTELRLNASRPFDGFAGDRRLADLTVHYILLGSLREFTTSGSLRPYAGGQAGLVVFDPRSARFGSETRLAVGLTGGVRGALAGPVGWKAQTMLLLPLLWTEGGLFCGPGGCNLGLASGTAIVQMNLTAGLTYSF
jgi:hypothetical protein